jgi:hypothetical protein
VTHVGIHIYLFCRAVFFALFFGLLGLEAFYRLQPEWVQDLATSAEARQYASCVVALFVSLALACGLARVVVSHRAARQETSDSKQKGQKENDLFFVVADNAWAILGWVFGAVVVSVATLLYAQGKEQAADEGAARRVSRDILSSLAATRAAMVAFGGDCLTRFPSESESGSASADSGKSASSLASDPKCRDFFRAVEDGYLKLSWEVLPFARAVAWTRECAKAPDESALGRACAQLKCPLAEESNCSHREFVNAYRAHVGYPSRGSRARLADATSNFFDSTHKLGCVLAVAGSVQLREPDLVNSTGCDRVIKELGEDLGACAKVPACDPLDFRETITGQPLAPRFGCEAAVTFADEQVNLFCYALERFQSSSARRLQLVPPHRWPSRPDALRASSPSTRRVSSGPHDEAVPDDRP